VRERLAADRHGQLATVREIHCGFPPGHGRLLEKHFGGRSMPSPPLAHAPL